MMRIRPSSFRGNFSWMLVGTWVYAAGQWLVMIVLARFGSPVIVGRYALGQSIAAPLMKLGSLQLRMVLATDVRKRYRFGDFLTLRLLTTGLAFASSVGIGCLAGYGRETLLIIAAVALVKSVEEISDISFGVFQRGQVMRMISVSQSLKAVLGLAALIGVLWATGSALLGIAALGIAASVPLLWYDLPRARELDGSGTERGQPDSDRPYAGDRRGGRRGRVTDLARRGWPLGVIVAINSLAPNIPRYVIEASGGELALGIFSAISVIMRISFYVETALAQTVLPEFARLIAENNLAHVVKTLARFAAALSVLIAAMIVAVYFRGSDLMRFLFGPEYTGHEPALAVLILASGVGSMAGFIKSAVDAIGRYSMQIPILLTATSISALASLTLVPAFGILGGAVALLVSRAALLLGYAGALCFYGRQPTRGLEAC